MAQREADPSLKPPRPGHLCEECRQQLAWAERELGAFQKASKEIFGAEAAIQAAELWVTLAEAVAPSGSAGHPALETDQHHGRVSDGHMPRPPAVIRTSLGIEETMKSCKNDVIVVDDNPILLRVVTEILEERGWQVRSASDGFAALKEIRAQVPDILLSDLNMPGMSGFELLSVVRRRFPLIAVIAMSGAYSDQSVPSEIAADAFYPKGAGGVERLLELLDSIQIKTKRCATPIWIPPLPANALPTEALLASCPECLRPFSFYPVRRDETQQEPKCSHCNHSPQLALVRCSDRIDETPLSPLVDSTFISREAKHVSPLLRSQHP